MTNIPTFVGARPHFIKAAVVSRRIARLPDLKKVLVDPGFPASPCATEPNGQNWLKSVEADLRR